VIILMMAAAMATVANIPVAATAATPPLAAPEAERRYQA